MKGMRTSHKKLISISKKKICLVGLFIFIVVMLAIAFKKPKLKRNYTFITPDNLRIMEYGEFENGDEKVSGTDNVTFIAYFPRDIDGDGYENRMKGTCCQIKADEPLVIEMAVKDEGRVVNGKIEVEQGANFKLTGKFLKDDILKKSYWCSDANLIEFNEIPNGTEKMYIGNIYCDRRNWPDSSYFSKDNKIVFTGTYVDGNGQEIEIRKEITLMVECYGTGEAVLCDLNQTYYNLPARLDEENQEIQLDFNINTKEKLDLLKVNKNYVQGEIPQYNGYDPLTVTCNSGNVAFNYNSETRMFVINRETTLRDNKYHIKVTYPLEAYKRAIEPRISLEIPVKTYYELNNNPNDGFQNPYVTSLEKGTVKLIYREPIPSSGGNTSTPSPNEPTPVTTYSTQSRTMAKLGFYYGPDVYALSKKGPINEYQGVVGKLNETFLEYWSLYVGTESETNGVVFEQKSELGNEFDSFQFEKSDGTYVGMEDYITNIGIGFSSATTHFDTDMPEENSWVKVYDADTNELLVDFEDGSWKRYTDFHPYYYKTPVKHIRVETSFTCPDSYTSIINVKELDDESIAENISEEEFSTFEYIRSDFKATLSSGEVLWSNNETLYLEPVSDFNVSMKDCNISTQAATENRKIEINTNCVKDFNFVGWVNANFLVELPSQIIDVKINDIEIDNDKVVITNYEIIENDEGRFIKISTNNTNKTEQQYKITIDCDISPDPRASTAETFIKVYAANELVNGYVSQVGPGAFSREEAEDVFDVNNNLRTDDTVGYLKIKFDLWIPDTLLISQEASEFDDKGTVAISPQVAMIKPNLSSANERTSKIKVSIKNHDMNGSNSVKPISEIKVMGVIPFEGNSTLISNKNLNSSYTTQMVEGGITIPDQLEGLVTVYYSDNAHPTKEVLESSNNWKTATEVTDWSEIKTFLIDFNDYEITNQENYTFEYMIKIPNGVELNQTAYSGVGAYFCLSLEYNKLRTKSETTALGFRIADKYNLEISKYHIDEDIMVPGATYRVTKDGENAGKSGVTNSEGKLLLKDLLVGETYKIEEIKSPTEYILNNNIVEFTSDFNNTTGEISFEKISGTTKGDLSSTQNDGQYTLFVNVEDECKARLKIKKTDKNGGASLKGIKYKITGGEFSEIGKKFSTNENGEINLSGLTIGEIYTLEEVKATGYYLNKPLSFRINHSSNQYDLEVIDINDITLEEMGFKQYSVTKENGFPIVNLELEDTKIPTYNLKITKVKRVTNLNVLEEIQNGNTQEITYLPGAMFRLLKDGKNVACVTTDANGIATIDGLYQFETDRNIDQTYVLKEVVAPDQYSKGKDISFKVENESGSLVFEENIQMDQKPKQYLANGNTINLIYEDSPSFKLTKKDGDNGQVLANTKFAIYNTDNFENPATNSKGEVLGNKEIINGKEVYVLTTDANGEISVDLPEGIYKLNEIQTDEQYELDTDDYYFGIGTSGNGRSGVKASYAKVIGGEGEDKINCSIGTSDGGYILGGSYSSNSIVIDDNITLSGNDYLDGMLIKYNKAGIVDWVKKISGDSSTSVTNVIETPDKGFIAIVNHQGNLIFDDESTFNKTGEENNITLIKYSQSGEKEWTKEIINADDDSGYYIRPKEIINTSDSGYLIVCDTDCDSINVGSDIVLNNYYSSSGMIVKCDDVGEPVWAEIISEGNVESISALCEVEDGEYIISYRSPYYDGYIARYNSAGEQLSEDAIGYDSLSICKTNDGGYCMGGSFYGYCAGDEVYADGYGIIIYDENGEAKKFIATSQVKSIQPYDGGIYVLCLDDGSYPYKINIYNYSLDGEIESVSQVIGVIDRDVESAITLIPDNGCIVRVNCNNEINADLGNNVFISKSENDDYDGIIIKYANKNMVKSVTKNLQRFGLEEKDNLARVSATEDGGYMVIGNFTMNSSISTAFDLYGNSFYSDQLDDEHDYSGSGDEHPLDKLYLDEENYVINNPVIKYSGGRTIEWVNEIEGNLNEVVSTSDGGCIVECYHWGRIGDKHEYVTGHTLVKYGPKGELEWFREIDIPKVTSMVQTQDGGYLVSGSFSHGVIFENDLVINSNGREDGIILKYDSKGIVKWANVVGDSDNDIFRGVCELSDGSYVAVGEFSGESLNVGNGIVLNGNGRDTGMVLKYDKYGQIEDAHTITIKSSESESIARLSSVAPMDDGGYVVSGYTTTGFEFNNDVRIDSGAFIVKYNNLGEVVWAKNIIGKMISTGKEEELAIKVKNTFSGNILVYGMYNERNLYSGESLMVENTILPMYSSNDHGNNTALILSYDKNGEFKWGDTIGADERDTHISGTTMIKDGSIISVGDFNSYSLEKGKYSVRNYHDGTSDGFLWEISPQVKADEMQELEFSNYRKTYNVSTSVEEFNGVKGGTISGENQSIYETIKYGDSSSKEIRIEPDENYKLVSITINGVEQVFETQEDGSYILPQLENVTEDKEIKVKFLLKDNTITINKIDNETNEYLPDAEFKLDQIEERAEPVTEELLGDLTDNSSAFYEISNKETDEIIGPIGALTDNGQATSVVHLISNANTENALGEVTENGTYYFVDDGSGSLIPTNGETYQRSIGNTGGVRKTVANSYVEIDLSGLQGQYMIVVNAEASCSSSGCYGFATINQSTTAPLYSNTSGRFMYIYGQKIARDYKSGYLEGGQVYYLHLGYRKDSYDYLGDQIKINSIKLYETNEATETYNFIEEDGKYVSSNQFVDSSESSSYIPIDLTGYEGRYELIVNAEISSQSSSDFGYATIKSNTTKPTYNSSSGRFIYISGTKAAKDYSTVLQGGNAYYLHLGYYKDTNTSVGDDKFTINSLNLYKQTERRYNFIENNGRYESTNQGKDNTTCSSYIPLDLTEHPGKYILTINAEISSENSDDGYVNISDNINGSYSSRVLTIWGIKEAADYKLEIDGGKMQYIHLKYRKSALNSAGDDTFIVNSIRLELSDSELYHTTVKTNGLGKAITQIPFGKYKLTETIAPKGYELSEEEQIIEFRSYNTAQHEYTVSDKKLSNVLVHHLEKGTNTKLSDDEIIEGKVGDKYTTLPRSDIEGYDLERDENDELILPINREGTFANETQEVTYNYVSSPCNLIVHHYLEGTETRVPLNNGELADDVISTGELDSSYTTEPLSDDVLDERYELVEIPRNAEGTYSFPQVEVTYNYREIERDITIRKTDLSTGDPLENVKFEIMGQGDNVEKIYFYVFGSMTKNGEYGFVNDSGKYIPTNGYTYQSVWGDGYDMYDTVANSYVKVDLSQLTGRYVVKFDAYVSSEEDCDYGFAAINDNVIPPAYDSDNNIMCLSGEVAESEYTSSVLEGGNIYYLHLGYYQNDDCYSGEDQIAFSNIALYTEDGTTKVSEMGQMHEKIKDLYYYTNQNGKIRLSLKGGSYEIKELETNEGYVLDSEPKTLVISKGTENGYYDITNDKPRGRVIVHHYINGTTEHIMKNGVPIEDEIKTGYIGDVFETSAREDITEYSLVSGPDEACGLYTEDDIELTYYYEEARIPAAVQVHYYLDGTTNPVKDVNGDNIQTVTLEGYVGDQYTTTEPNNIAEYYELIAEPTNKNGPYTEELTEVVYYYKLKDYNYNVEYYYDGVKDSDKTETKTAQYQSVISTYTDKVITGYKFDRTEGLPLTITENADNNVIKVYYVKDNFNYTVEYYYDGVKDNDKTDTQSVEYQSVINTYTDKNITGYKLDKTEGLPLTISENFANNVIKVYYIKDNFNYTVEYYYDGAKDADKTETKSAEYQSVVNTYTDKSITGYKLDKTEGLPLTITENADNNVIKVYYVKDKFDYTVEYYYDGVKNAEKTETIEATFQDEITTYTDKNITGYKLDKTEGLPLTITENADNNIIKVYYIKDNFNYKVEYYYDGVKDNDMTDTQSAEYQSVINTYTDKNITGYKLDKTEGLPLTITENADDNVIKVYYVKDNFGYTVEYYYDGAKDEDKTETKFAEYQSIVNTYTDKNITGYKLFGTENLPLTITENAENNVIKVYYVKDNFGYTVEYYYDGVKDNEKTETKTAQYQSVISTYIDKDITGYKLDKTEGVPLTITENADNNVIKVYYVKDNFDYTVEYYYDGVKDNDKTDTLNATYQDEITTYTDKNITGYKLDKTEGLPLTVTENAENNIIKVYYVKDNFGYTVEYYYDGVKDSDKTETKTAQYQSVISTYTDKNITGYRLDRAEGLPLTISTNSSNNVIKVYYIKDNFDYTVEYYYDGAKDADKTETESAEYQSVINTYTDKNITGYKLDKTEGLPLTITENVDNNIIKVYYIKDNFNYTVEYYYDGVKDNDKTDTLNATYQDGITTYTDKNITGYKLDKTEGLPLTITENEDNNIIKVYYKKDNFNYVVEYYYDGVKDNDKTDTLNATYQDEITTYTDKNITGYKLDKTEGLPLTITENADNNVIKVYYVKDNFGYTVEYYYDGVKDNEKTETLSATYQDVISTYTDKNITGYKLDKTEGLTLTVTENADNNVIKVYYIKDSFNYTVEYYYDGVKDNDKTYTQSAEYQSVINAYADKNITGYKLDKAEGLPLTVTENAENNIIKVYYVKDNFGYTVEYYYDGEKDSEKTETKSAEYQSLVETYENKNITGYKLDKTEGLPLTISENSGNNVIKVYYIKDSFNYTVEYYYDGVKDTDKTETQLAEYQSVVNTYTDKNITGYKLSETENLPLTITENADNNIIKVFYIKDIIGYRVEYYYDGIKNNEKTETIEATYQDVITTYTDKNVTGYKLDKTEGLPLTITENIENNVIKVYYVKDNFGYTVEYYYDGVKNNEKTDTLNATYQDEITTYTNKNITGYKLDKTEGLPLTITENAENNIIKIYYVKDNFDYKVEYYYDGVIDSDKSETQSAEYQSVIETYTDKNITGHKLDKTEGLPLTITENIENNVIKVYYVKDNFDYKVEYYYDGVKDADKTETKSSEYQSVVNTYTDKNITGYKLDKAEGLPLTITENTENNIIKVYYVKDNFGYTVEYYYDGVKDSDKTETKTAQYQSVISTYTDKNITGYRLDRAEGLPLTISTNSSNNVIKVYYIKDNFGYSVEYYYDGVKDTEKTDIQSAEYQSVVNTYTDKNITGYKLDRTEGLPLTITENSDNNVIKVYYVKDSFDYTIEYYYDGVKDSNKTETKTAQYQSVISTYTDKNITGYKLDKTEGLPLTITENADNNVIKVYYIKDNFGYTVEYYYDGAKDADKTETQTAEYQSIVNTYTDKNITGYKLDKAEGLPLTITENTENNIIKVYYVKDNFGYTVEYYYDGVKDSDKTETKTAQYQSLISTYTDKNITGYKLDKTEGLPLTVTENVDNNIIKVYYVKDNFGYTVEYYYDGVKDTEKTDIKSAEYQSVVNTYTDKNITGYKLDKTEGLPLSITENVDNNIIKVYYIKDNFGYTVEYYYDGAKDSDKTETKSAEYQSVVNTYTDKNITGYKFDKTEGLPLTITENADNNVIKVYYVKDNFGYTVEYYYDGVKDAEKTDIQSAEYQSVVNTYTDKNITGYKLDRTEGLPLTITENADNNVIKVYYVKDNFDYTVEYYYDGTKDSNKTETKSAEYQSVIETYTDKNITGYKLDKTEGLPLTITENTDNNVIKVYYVKDNFGYTVEYYYDGAKDANKTDTKSAEYQSIVNTYTDMNITGYKLDKAEGLPLTVTENVDSNVIKVYYVKDSFNYTVEYYYDEVRDNEKTETISATYQDEITTYTDKNITGYKLDKTEGLPLTITENADNNVIKVYYVKDNFGYTVEYYYDGAKDSDKTETKTAQYQSVISTYTDKNITGYRLDRTEGLPLTISTNSSNNVIKVYYIKDNFGYSVEYYYDGVKDTEKTDIQSAEYQSVVNTYTDKNITGYKLDKTEGLPLTVTENVDSNVVKVYYVKDSFNYTVEYYYDGVKDNEKTDTLNATYQDEITTYTDKNITGYKLDRTEGLPLTITENAENNVSKVYYVKDNFNYKVEYYYDGVKDDDKTDTQSAEYHSVINTYTDKNITGYKLSGTENLPLTITENEDNNIIKVFYIKDVFGYTVEYYYDGTKNNEKTETIEATYQDVITTYTDKNISGYKLDKTEGLPLTITENANNNIIKVYYIKDNFGYTVEYYYDGAKDSDKTETKSAEYQSVVNTYTDKNITGYKLDKTEGLPLTITENVDNNVIKVYYVKDNFSYTIEYYYDGVKDTEKTDTLTAAYQDEITTYTDKNIIGYKLDKTESLPLTITENSENNVIKVYYVKDDFNYTVEYYYDGVKDTEKTETQSAEYQSVISTYTDKNIAGYKLSETENLPLTITENADNNIIKVFYVKDIFGYTVEYYYDGIKNNEKTETIEATYQDVITTYTDKNITGYKLDEVEGLPLTITENTENNVIKVYYVKDNFDYTVEYYYDGVKDTEKSDTLSATYLDEITTYTDKSVLGYELDKTEGLPLIVTENPDNNIIKVYYKKMDAKVIVKYINRYSDNIIETEVIEGKVGDVIIVQPKEIDDYILEDNQSEKEITMTVDDIEVEFYYVRVLKGFLEKHIDVYTNAVLYEELHDDAEWETYVANPREFNRYLQSTNRDYYEKILRENPDFLIENGVESVDEYMENNNIAPDDYYLSNEEIDEDVKEIKYYYTPKARLVIRYIDITTGEEITEEIDGEIVSSTEEIEGRIYQDYEAQEKSFENYISITNRRYYKMYLDQHPEELTEEGVETVDEYMEKKGIDPRAAYVPKNMEGTLKVVKKSDGTFDFNTEVIFYFGVERQVVVKYIDKITGEEIGEETIKIGPDGDEYDVSDDLKELEGYTLVEIPEETSGIYEEKNEPKHYYYAKNTHITVKYVDEDTGKGIDAAENYEIKGYEGKEYSTDKKNFKGYEFKDVVGTTEGHMSREPIEVIYYYRKVGTIAEQPVNNINTNTENSKPTVQTSNNQNAISNSTTSKVKTTTISTSDEKTKSVVKSNATTNKENKEKTEKELLPATGDISTIVYVIMVVVIISNVGVLVLVKTKNKE